MRKIEAGREATSLGAGAPGTRTSNSNREKRHEAPLARGDGTGLRAGAGRNSERRGATRQGKSRSTALFVWEIRGTDGRRGPGKGQGLAERSRQERPGGGPAVRGDLGKGSAP